jgi:hypothetical protein
MTTVECSTTTSKHVTRAVVAAAFAALALVAAAPAAAESVKFNATAGQLQTACKKVGGDYHQSTSGNYYCVTKTGVGGCNPQGDCSYNPSGPAPKPGAPTLLQVVGTVGVAG